MEFLVMTKREIKPADLTSLLHWTELCGAPCWQFSDLLEH